MTGAAPRSDQPYPDREADLPPQIDWADFAVAWARLDGDQRLDAAAKALLTAHARRAPTAREDILTGSERHALDYLDVALAELGYVKFPGQSTTWAKMAEAS